MKPSLLQRGGVWVLAQAVLMAAVFTLAVLRHARNPHPAFVACGVLTMIAGAAIGLAGAVALGHNLTPLPHPRDESRLVRSGIYARIRHPLYTSVTLAALGWALAWQSWPAGLAALCLAPFFAAKARREERWLRAKFPEYDEYARQTPGFLPRLF